MKAGWQVKKLGEVCEIRPPKDEARKRIGAEEMVSFVPMEDLGIDRKYLVATQLKTLNEVVCGYTYFADGDVLLAKITPCFENGKLGIAQGLKNKTGFGSSEYVVFRPMSCLHHEFLYYYLYRQKFRDEGVLQMSGAVGHKRVSKEFIESHPIPIPPLPEQQRIVAILDEAFDSIATAKTNAEQNLKNARELFDSVFAKEIHCEEISDKGGQELVDLCELIVDCEHKTAPLQEEGIPSIRTPNVGKGLLLLDDVNLVSDETYKKWTRRAEPREGDLILAREAPAGNVAVIPENIKVCLGQRTVLLRPKANIVDSRFLAYYILHPDNQSRLLAHSRGATVQHVNMKDIRALKICSIPPLPVQRSIVARLDALSAETQRLEAIYRQKINALDELKQSLLQRAFAGEL